LIEIVPDYYEDKEEFKAALQLKQKLIDEYPDLEDSNDRKLKMIIEPCLDGGTVFSVDILLIGIFNNKKNIKIKSGSKFPFAANVFMPKESDESNESQKTRVAVREVELINFISCIEVKLTDQGRVFKETNHIMQRAYGKVTDVTHQNLQQVYTLKNQLAKNQLGSPKITRFMYFPNLDSSNELNDPYLIHSESSGKDILTCISQSLMDLPGKVERMIYTNDGPKFVALSDQPQKNTNIYLSSFSRQEANTFYDAEFLATPEAPTNIDMKRMNTIAKESVSIDWIDAVGNKTVIFQGLGGTGKTIRLLQIAYKKYYDDGANSLLLTYNWALISNLRRLMAVMGISQFDEKNGGIRIESLERFMYKLLGKYKLYADREEIIEKGGWNKVYPKLRDELAELLKAGATDGLEAMEFLELDMDYCFVDEGQDWSESEQVIVKEIFGEKNIVVAHGKAQDTRGQELHWDKNIEKDLVKKVHTRKALRMKPNLSQFVKTFAKKALKNDEFINLKEDDKSLGGQVYLVIGDYFKDPKVHEYIVESNPEDVEIIDNLFCIQHPSFGEQYKEIFGEVWEGYSNNARRISPHKLNQARFINYKSCRGLEGWTSFNFSFDDFWDAQKKEGAKEFHNAKNKDLLYDQISYSNDYAAKWALIAFTRSIDSTVIHLSNAESEIAKILLEIQENMSEVVELIRID
jgi:hypothetical protein